ncbi:hypothetical protein L798_15028 [Zootermopsis nevadensis]|uniref:Uncharacterized protein n=1 Tax=Zootermopsis nevadensis TaxID=136037 RepID=A0A067R167_ZOONE|nr:hypothetical protein L798_15028 [Zootermopsis nevadensis]
MISKPGLSFMFPADSVRLNRPPNVLITTSSNVVPSQQQNTWSLTTSPSSVGKIKTKTASLLQLPAEARKIAHVAPRLSAKSCQINVSNAIQNSSSFGVNQQVVDLERERLSSSASCSCPGCFFRR